MVNSVGRKQQSPSNVWMSMLLFFVCVFPVLGCTQTLTLSGSVLDKWDENDTLFYTFNDAGFDPKKFVICDEKKYKLILTKKEIESQQIQDVVFLANRNTDLSEDYACAHRIYLSRILAAKNDFSANFSVYSDLQLNYFCSASVMYGAQMEGEMKFVGNYHVFSGQEARIINLKDVFFKASSQLPKQDEFLMTMESGSWDYNEQKGELTIYLGMRSNPYLGLFKTQSTVLRCTVLEENGVLTFRSDKLVWNKLD